MIKKKELLAQLARAEAQIKRMTATHVRARDEAVEELRRLEAKHHDELSGRLMPEELRVLSIRYFQKAIAAQTKTPVGRATFNRNLGAAIAFGKAALEAGAELEDGDES